MQTTRTSLRVRLQAAPDTDQEQVWQNVQSALTTVLQEHHLAHVTLERGEEPPQPASGGKYRRVIPFEDERG